MGTGNRMIEIQKDEEFKEILDHLITTEQLGEKASGVARHIIGKGMSLSKKQQYVYDKEIHHLITSTCNDCECTLDTLDNILFAEENGRCSACQNLYQKTVIDD